MPSLSMEPLLAPGQECPGAQHATLQQVRHTNVTGDGLYPDVSEVSFISNSAAVFQGSLPLAIKERTRAMSDC